MMNTKPTFRFIPIDKLSRCRYQPRMNFDKKSLEELATSIKTNGLLQPIIARPIKNNNFEILAGERRWRAAQIIGLEEIPCLIKEYSDQQAAAASAVENINRVNLNPVEEAFAYQQLSAKFQLNHTEISIITGKSRSKITNSLRLLSLPAQIQEMLVNSAISEGHGKILAGLPPEHQINLANLCVTKFWSIRRLEQEIKKQSITINKKSPKKDINILALEQSLSKFLGSPVTIQQKKEQGCMIIEYNNLKILDGIFKKINFDPNNNS